MMLDRLADLQNHLVLLYEQLAGEEDALIKAELAEKTRIKQRITTIWKEINNFEREYTQRLSQQVKRSELPEETADEVVAELVDEIEHLTQRTQHSEIKRLLGQILDELRKKDIPASAKLKLAIPLIPGVLAYEIEGDTERGIRRLFPTFERIYQTLRATSVNVKK